MKNISTILSEIGITIPEEQQETFNSAFNANYKTVNEVTALNTKLTNLQTKYDEDIQARDTSLASLQADLQAAGTDKQALDDLTARFTQLQQDNETAKTQYQEQLAKQQKEFLIREKVNALKFSSNSAKKAFTADVLAQNLTVSDGQLLGFDDYVNKYKETDADAFATEQTEGQSASTQKKPSFAAKTETHNDPQPQHKDVPVVW